jgi:hypothetical protein
LFKPGEVVQEVRQRLPYRFSIDAHTRAWRHHKVRPGRDDPHPERTLSEYCVYDDVHEDYVYTPAWVEKLVRELSIPGEFQKIVGRQPVAK